MKTVSGRIAGGDPGRAHRPARAATRRRAGRPRPPRAARRAADAAPRTGPGAAAFSSSTRRVCAPDWYWATTRPVVSSTGYSSSGSSAAAGARRRRTGPARRRGEPVEEEPGRAGVGARRVRLGAIRRPGPSGRHAVRRVRWPARSGRPSAGVGRRARPEHPVLLRDPPVGDARVVRGPARATPGAAPRRPPPGPSGSPSRAPSRRGQPVQHLQVAADSRRRRDRPPAQQHPALQVGRRARLLRPLGDRQHHVRQRRRLRQHHVRDREEVQRPQPLLDMRGARRGHHRVGAHQQQRPDVRRPARRAARTRCGPGPAACPGPRPTPRRHARRAAGSSSLR